MKRAGGSLPKGSPGDEPGTRPRRKRNFKGLQLPLSPDLRPPPPDFAPPLHPSSHRAVQVPATPACVSNKPAKATEPSHPRPDPEQERAAHGRGTALPPSQGRTDLSASSAFDAVGMWSSQLDGPLLYSDLEFLADLGIGSSGTVALVRHRPSGQIMARKSLVVDAKPAIRKQALLELKVLQHCRAPEIVGCYGSLLHAPYICLAIEFVHPGSLDRIVHPHLAWSYPLPLPPDEYPPPRESRADGADKSNPLPPPACARVIRSALKGMIYLYDQHRIIHRDIKPSNVLLSWAGEVKLCDFGVSKELTDSAADTFVGTSTYMSPERIQGQMYTITSDVWSLGLALMEAALGRMPFMGDGTDQHTAHLTNHSLCANPTPGTCNHHLPSSQGPGQGAQDTAASRTRGRRGKALPAPIRTPAPGLILHSQSQSGEPCEDVAFLHSPIVGTPVGASGFRSPAFAPLASPVGPTRSPATEAPWGILDLLQRIVHEPAPRLPSRFPEPMRAFAALCLEKDPAARPTPHSLLSHPFLELGEQFDLSAWLREVVG